MEQRHATRAVNIRREPFDIYVGRPGRGQHGPWGNPYAVGRDGTRADVLRRFHAYILRRPDLLVRLGDLRGKRLGCFCAPRGGLPGALPGDGAPLICHAQILAALADGLAEAESPAKPSGEPRGEPDAASR